MLSKIVAPKTKNELIEAIRRGSFRSFQVLEGSTLASVPSVSALQRAGATVVVLQP